MNTSRLLIVGNNCSTGSTALYLARQAVQSGAVDCALVLGFEQMNPGALGTYFPDRASPSERFDEVTEALVGHGETPLELRYFGGAGLAHMQQYGTKLSIFAKIRAKASRHAARNPKTVFRDGGTEEEVLTSKEMWPGVMTRLIACPRTCGAAAAVVCSQEFARKHGLNSRVRIRAQAMTTDGPQTFASGDMREVVGFSADAQDLLPPSISPAMLPRPPLERPLKRRAVAETQFAGQLHQ